MPSAHRQRLRLIPVVAVWALPVGGATRTFSRSFGARLVRRRARAALRVGFSRRRRVPALAFRLVALAITVVLAIEALRGARSPVAVSCALTVEPLVGT